MAEFDLIARIAAHQRLREDVVLGIGDDGALLAPPAGQQLVAVCDTLNSGVHFPVDTAPADIGWKALAVNLSDLAAMGAHPAWALLSLSLPQADGDFIEAFMRGFSALAGESGIALVGGDTTRGPLSVCVTALGFVPQGEALTRSGAQPGDAVFVSGTLGDAAAALQQRSRSDDPALRFLCARLDRPTPRLALGKALRGLASAAIDISDGLLADLAHIAQASSVGIQLQAAQLPLSAALAAVADPASRLCFQATGGDDYELAFTVPAAQVEKVQALADACQVPVSRIGDVVRGEGVQLHDARGQAIHFTQPGWEHFSASHS